MAKAMNNVEMFLCVARTLSTITVGDTTYDWLYEKSATITDDPEAGVFITNFDVLNSETGNRATVYYSSSYETGQSFMKVLIG